MFYLKDGVDKLTIDIRTSLDWRGFVYEPADVFLNFNVLYFIVDE